VMMGANQGPIVCALRASVARAAAFHTMLVITQCFRS
jgi:hypothetical protein